MNHYASVSRRIGALLIDLFILTFLSLIGSHLVLIAGGVLVWILYAPVLESSSVRATLGKHLMGIQVCDAGGEQLTFRAALLRNFVKGISTVLLFIGFFIALFTAKKQTLHDLAADTYVVYGRSNISIWDSWTGKIKEILR